MGFVRTANVRFQKKRLEVNPSAKKCKECMEL